MAMNNYDSYLQADVVRIKKYFYVIRPLLAARWIIDKKKQPPMLLSELMEAELPVELRPVVDRLLEMKRNVSELGTGLKIKELDDYIDKEFVEIKKVADEIEVTKHDWKALDEFFYRVVNV